MPVTARANRNTTVNALKRDLIREAAKRVFLARGLSAASVREIALQAGYTTGAIYFHYASKEEIYADVLSGSLAALHETVSAAAAKEADAVRSLTAAYRAFIAFYRTNPRDLSLGLYLFEGAGPRGLNAKLNRDLNERFLGVMQIFETGLGSAGVKPRESKVEAVALFNEMVGLLIAANTGRLNVFGVDTDTMTERHVAWLQRRVEELAGASGSGTASSHHRLRRVQSKSTVAAAAQRKDS
jgi:AcrR family transcriptional regulator